uniref:Uncharacterized protein n=1 Tax=Anguilla anguilla TaxID=7936 RepID=A0A0E9US77_ANGAN
MSTKTLFSLGVVLIVLVTIVAGGLSSGSGDKTYSYDLSKAPELRRLYNSGVYKAERMKRPLGRHVCHSRSFQSLWSQSNLG